MIQELTTGTIAIETHTSHRALDELFGFAERRNPKRSFLFVSKVLGRHIPVKPSTMREVYRQLAAQIPHDVPSPLLCIGMAETAVGLAAGVFEEVIQSHPDSVLLTTTRHPVEGELFCEFKEEHSHATDHLVYWPTHPQAIARVKNARTLVLIDDEATTGNTFKNLTQALTKSALTESRLNHIDNVLTITLTDWSENALSHAIDLPTTSIALAHGRWHWSPYPDAQLPVMPDVNITAQGSAPLCRRQDWGRLGMIGRLNTDWLADFAATNDEKVLVLGTSEFVYVPFLLAEHLEQQGAQVVFGTTTRSPIADGLAIQSSIAFSDNYGLGIPNYCYNIFHQRFDRILLCIETDRNHVDQQCLRKLAQIAPRVEVIVYGETVMQITTEPDKENINHAQ